MDKPEIRINVDQKDGVLVIEHRTGEALELRNPHTIDISGDLNAPRTFYDCRTEQFPVATTYCHCSANTSQLTIELVGEDRAVDRIVVRGKGKANPLLDALVLSGDRGHTIPELVKILRKRRVMFPDPEVFQSLLRSLTAFKATIDTKIEDSKESSGSVKKLLEKGVKSDVPESFAIEVQPYLSGPKLPLLVETEVTAHADHVTVSLFAFGLDTAKRQCAIEVFSEMTATIAKAGIPVIHDIQF